jgi:hypothetical protein
MKLKQYIRRAAAAVLLVAILTAAGCKPPTASPAETTAPPERPTVTAAPDKVQAPAADRFEGYSVRLKPARGPIVILKEPIAAQLIMDAFSSQRLQVKDAIGKFDNKVEVLNPSGETQYTFTLTSDGQQLMKSQDGRVFHMPEYIYYLLEDNLWSYSGSLMDNLLKWVPDPKSTAQPMLELELPRLLKAGMLPAYGYALSYFCTYKIYGVNTATRNTAKVYLLMTYAGYDIKGVSFAPNFLYTTPVTLIFTKVSGDNWTLTELKQPPVSKEKKDVYTNVRVIFPYEYMDTVMDDLKTPDSQVTDIVRQATEYLNDMGITGLTVDS